MFGKNKSKKATVKNTANKASKKMEAGKEMTKNTSSTKDSCCGK